MLKHLRRERDEEGFTLIELMVVVLIISILIAIAIPTFLGAREGAQDRGAQSNLRNALTSAKTLYADESDFDTIEAGIAAIEPSLTFSDAAVTAAGTTSMDASGQTVVFAALSESGDCFYIREIASGTNAGTTFAIDGAADGTVVCNAASAPSFAGSGDTAWTTGGW